MKLSEFNSKGDAFGEFPRDEGYHESFRTNALIVGHALDHADKPRGRKRWLARKLRAQNRDAQGLTIDEARDFLHQIGRLGVVGIFFDSDYAETENIKSKHSGVNQPNRDGDRIDNWKIGQR